MESQCSGSWAEQQALQQLEAQGWRLLDRKGEMLSQINQKVPAVQATQRRITAFIKDSGEFEARREFNNWFVCLASSLSLT